MRPKRKEHNNLSTHIYHVPLYVSIITVRQPIYYTTFITQQPNIEIILTASTTAVQFDDEKASFFHSLKPWPSKKGAFASFMILKGMLSVIQHQHIQIIYTQNSFFRIKKLILNHTIGGGGMHI